MDFALHPALVEDGRFEVKHCLGSGGFGVVFAVYDKRTDAHVALKWLRHSDAATIARFKREFRSLADIVHSNLVGFRELITVGGEWFFTMDLVNGVELLEWVRPASPIEDVTRSTASMRPDAFGSTVALPSSRRSVVPSSAPTSSDPEPDGKTRPLCAADLPRLRATLEQLAAGLHALHSAGMLHRDVKPSNVLVNREGRVVLLDFGLVTEMGRDDVAQTITGKIVGTPAYMSPEQAMGNPVGPASDWYSVGAILFQALTGKVPFEGDTPAILIRKQLQDAPQANAIVRGVPRALSQLCTDLLARAPEQRPTYKEFIDRLQAALPIASSEIPTSNPSLSSAALDSSMRTAVFVGRETHLWALDEATEEVERGKTVVALVHGTSGIGKSALVRRFLDTLRAERPETVILEGRCYERESMPYKALDSLVDALCRYLQRLSDVEAAKLLPRDRDLSALARVFPVFLQFEIGSSRRRAQVRGDAVQERRRAFEALRELLARVADRNPVVLFIDDLQWGDGDSEPLLTALFRPPDPPPLLLIAVYRSEDGPTSPLVRALRKLAGGGSSIEVCEIPVGELSPDAARGLASSLLGTEAEKDRVDELARESFGSPLFLRQLAAVGATSTRVDLASVLAQRLEGLSPDARRLLETLAVSGKPLALSTAARAAGIEHDAQGVVAKLRAETLVRTRGGEARDELEIYHDKIREIVVARLTEDDLKSRHRKLARALSSAGEGDAEALATHFLIAGERALAAEYAEMAAERAAGALAFARAAEMYEMAIDAGSTLGRNTDALSVKLAEALLCAGRSRDAADRFVEAARRAPGADALELRRRAAEQLLFCGRIDEGLKVVEQILDVMKMRAPKTRWGAVLSLLWRRILLRIRGLRFKERTADQLARDRLVAIDTCYSIALGLGMVDPIRGADFQTRYLLHALAAGEPLRIAKGFALEAAYRAADGGKARAAIDLLLARARSLADRVGHAHAQALTTLMSGVARVILGDFAAAIPLCDRAGVELRERCTGVAWELDNAAFFAGFSRVACGHIRELSERIPTLIEDARGRGDLYGEVLLRLQCSWFVALAQDQVAEAEAELSAITEEWSKDRFLLQHAWRMVNVVEIALYKGDHEAALREISDTWPKLERSLFLRTASMRVRAHNAIGRVALAAADAALDSKDDRSAKTHLDVAARSARIVAGVQWSLAKGLSLLLDAGVEARRGDRAAASALYDGAAAELEEKGARLYAIASRARYGELLGGTKGDDLVKRSFEELAAERIARPEKMVRVFAPGRELNPSE